MNEYEINKDNNKNTITINVIEKKVFKERKR